MILKNRASIYIPEIGSDKGVYFSDQLNLRKLTVQYSTYDFYTEIEPYGKDGLTIETVNSGKIYLENHQYSSKKNAVEEKALSQVRNHLQ